MNFVPGKIYLDQNGEKFECVTIRGNGVVLMNYVGENKSYEFAGYWHCYLNGQFTQSNSKKNTNRLAANQ